MRPLPLKGDKKVDKKVINGTDLQVSRICLGTMHYGDVLNQEQVIQQLDAFLDFGGNFIDTAHVYGRWVPGLGSSSEKYIGKWFEKSKKRNAAVLSTKGCHPALDNRSVSRVLPEFIHHDLMESLDHLKTDYIDIYFLHRDNPDLPVDVIIDALEKERKAGNIRYYGCSNWKPERILAANEYAKSIGAKGFVINQLMFSLADVTWKGVEDKTLECMDTKTHAFQASNHMDVMAYSSIAKGYFNKKYFNKPIEELINDVYGSESNEAMYKSMEPFLGKLRPIDVEIQFLLHFPGVNVFPITSFSTMEQMRQGFAAEQAKVPQNLLDVLQKEKKYII